MKKILYLFLLCTFSIYSQEFKPFKVKSGKIIYEKLHYLTQAGFSSAYGIKTSFSEQIPYVAEQVIYYWNEFGNVAFEETYTVSDFGGKPLSKKIKIAERLWKGDHRYYFNILENKISDDPFHLRIICRENFQYYQLKDSWIETLYIGTEKLGTKEIIGKQAAYYRIDNFQDICTWKGLVLKDESFATTINGERLYPDSTKNAIKIDTHIKINETLFNPIWLKREKLYQFFDGNKINELLDARQNLFIQADNIDGIKIKKNDILLYVSTNLKLGKMQILSINKDNLSIKFDWYNNDNSVGSYRDLLNIKENTYVNLDTVSTNNETSKKIDFKFKNTITPILFPENNIGIYLLKSSRK